jgi:hypothetical protein
MCPIDSENNKEQLEDLSSELSENKNSRKTDESPPVVPEAYPDDPSIKLDRLGAAPSVTLSPSLSTDE